VASPDAPSSETSKAENAPAAVDPTSETAGQIESPTSAQTPLPPAIETTDHAESAAQVEAKDVPAPQATELATNSAGEYLDPGLGTPLTEKSNPLSHQPSEEEVTGLSKRTTASSDEASGPELEREDPDTNPDVIPASRQTTASADEEPVPLEKVPTREPGADRMTEGEPGKASAEEV